MFWRKKKNNYEELEKCVQVEFLTVKEQYIKLRFDPYCQDSFVKYDLNVNGRGFGTYIYSSLPLQELLTVLIENYYQDFTRGYSERLEYDKNLDDKGVFLV